MAQLPRAVLMSYASEPAVKGSMFNLIMGVRNPIKQAPPQGRGLGIISQVRPDFRRQSRYIAKVQIRASISI